MSINYKSLLPHIIALVVIVLFSCMYFAPQFQNKVIRQGDLIQYKGMAKEVLDFRKETGEETLWTNSMFGGMPTYQITSRNPSNLLVYVDNIMHLGIPRPAGLFIFGMICFYLMMILLGVNPWLSMIGSILFAFSTGNMLLFEAGHVTKLKAIMASPLVIIGFIQIVRKKYLSGGLIFTIGLGLNIFANHPQMTYYLALVLGIWMLVVIFDYAKVKDFKNIGYMLAVFTVGCLLALGTSASKLITSYNYGKDTMRGKPILESTNGTPSSSSETDGLEWNYAMNWSNGAKDLLSSFIPHAVGGASGEYISEDSNLGKAINSNRDFQAPMYFGDLPFTSGPYYFGVIAFLLFFLSLFVLNNPMRIWLATAFIFTMFLSLGKNFEFFNRLFYDYFPLFNKFRTPNSVLSVTQLFIPLGAILGLSQIMKEKDNKEKFIKPLYISAGVLGLICLFVALAGSSLFSFETANDAGYGEAVRNAIIEDRKSLMVSSAWRSLIYILLAVGVIYSFLKSKISILIATILIGILGVIDLFQIDKKYLNNETFVTERNLNKEFEPRQADLQILADKDPNFRVYDVTTDPFNSAKASYFHKTIGGYHAAKLQRFQDLIDRHISKNNMSVLNMLNTKYFIVNGENQEPLVQRNTAALGNAWFVNGVKIVDSANEEIDALDKIDPAGEVVVHKEFENYVAGLEVSKNGLIALKSYAPNRLVYNSKTEGDQFAVFSEIWYGPNKGWNAYIDGEPVEHIRVNYVLRGMKIPSGEHEIVFEFRPSKYYLGEKISLASSIIIILLGLVFIGVRIFASIKV